MAKILTRTGEIGEFDRNLSAKNLSDRRTKHGAATKWPPAEGRVLDDDLGERGGKQTSADREAVGKV